MTAERLPHRWKALGFTFADYDRTLQAQGGVCAIAGCGATPKTRRLHVDHEHGTTRVRGLLCMRHNKFLPAWITPEQLRAMADYLEAAT